MFEFLCLRAPESRVSVDYWTVRENLDMERVLFRGILLFSNVEQFLRALNRFLRFEKFVFWKGFSLTRVFVSHEILPGRFEIFQTLFKQYHNLLLFKPFFRIKVSTLKISRICVCQKFLSLQILVRKLRMKCWNDRFSRDRYMFQVSIAILHSLNRYRQ